MNSLLLVLTIITCVTSNGFAQIEAVDVADLTIKVGTMSTEEIYYGFAEGDEIVFSFEEVKGKPLKEIEIIELPTNSKFMDFKPISIVDKKIKVNKTAVYKFSFRNSALAGRICKIKIQRIPKSEDLISFNTNWEWKTLYDTTYAPYTQDSIVGYDTTHYTITKQRLIRDVVELKDVLTNLAVKVHSRYYKYNVFSDNAGELNEELVKIQLPQTMNTKYKKIENIVWYYGVGVNQKLRKNANKTKSDLLDVGGTIASLFLGGEMKVVFKLVDVVTSDNSDVSIKTGLFANYDQALLFMNDRPEAKALRWDEIVSSGSIRMETPLKGDVYLGLENENGSTLLTGGGRSATIYVNVSAWVRTREYEDYKIPKYRTHPKYVTLNKQRMSVKTSKVRVNAQ